MATTTTTIFMTNKQDTVVDYCVSEDFASRSSIFMHTLMINETAVKNKPVAGCRILFIFIVEAAQSSDIIKVNAERSITEYVE